MAQDDEPCPNQGALQAAHPLGVALMDNDHARLEALIGAAAQTPEHELPALLSQLQRELAAHFAREEDLMRAQNFPGLHCHTAQHELLLSEARRAGAATPGSLRQTIGVHIAQLVESHVLTLDTITAAFMRGEFGPENFDNLRLPIDPVRP